MAHLVCVSHCVTWDDILERSKTVGLFSKFNIPETDQQSTLGDETDSMQIVTVNPTLFRETLVPAFGFDTHCEAVVISAEEASIDKGLLCQLALDRMTTRCAPEEALLIDNKEENLVAWEARGGKGYLFTSDADFERDVARGIDTLPRS